jgi:hypothetical protein
MYESEYEFYYRYVYVNASRFRGFNKLSAIVTLRVALYRIAGVRVNYLVTRVSRKRRQGWGEILTMRVDLSQKEDTPSFRALERNRLLISFISPPPLLSRSFSPSSPFASSLLLSSRLILLPFPSAVFHSLHLPQARKPTNRSDPPLGEQKLAGLPAFFSDANARRGL